MFATLVLMASLLAPFASGWAMALGVADGRLLVICTGDGLRTIYIDDNGEATQLSDESVSCVLKSAADTAQAVKPDTPGQRLLFIHTKTSFHTTEHASRVYLAPRPRAPPLV